MADNVGVYINDRGTMYTIRDQEAFDTANSAKLLSEDAQETANEALALAEENAEKIDHFTESIVFNTHNEFPNIGDSSKLYVATDENKIYRWDSDTNIYVSVSGAGSDFNIIENYL